MIIIKQSEDEEETEAFVVSAKNNGPKYPSFV
jgi:hypothetical protein